MIIELLFENKAERKVNDYIDDLIRNNCNQMLQPYVDTKVSELPEYILNQIDENTYNYCISQNRSFSYVLRRMFFDKFKVHFSKDNNDIKYVKGLARIAIQELGFFKNTNFWNGENNIENQTAQDLTDLFRFISDSKEDLGLNEDLNGMSFEQLKQKFEKQKDSYVLNNKTDLNNSFNSTIIKSDYIIIPINSVEEAQEYGDYTRWCITKWDTGEENYNIYISGGKRFYFCLKDGFEDIEEEVGLNCPLDEYGLSMISVLVDADGNPDNITTRWNHEHDGEFTGDRVWNMAKQLQNILNRKFYDTFKPYTKEELKAMGIIRFDEVQELLDSGETLNNIFDGYDEYNLNGNKYYKVTLNNKWNYVTSDRKLLCDKWYYNIGDFNEGLAPVQREHRKWNFINKNGNEISNKWYYYVYYFIEGFARVQREDEMYNFIDKNGNEISKTWYYNNGDFNESFARVQREEDRKWNFIDKNGNEISNKWYYCVYYFIEGFAPVQREDEKFNFIDKNGNEISNKWYYYVYDFNEGLARVQREEDKKWNFIDKNGNETLNTWYYNIDDFKEGFARVQRKGDRKWNFIDKNGNEISKTWYYYVYDFNEGLARVQKEKNGKYIFIDKNGNEISNT